MYRVEAYLHQCVDSILNQSYQNLEVILVDDGSPDRCGAICEEFAERDARVRVIHKENGGLSSARNAGLDVARGEYISFVDSDDWLEPDAYTKVMACFQQTEGLSLVRFGFNLIAESQNVDLKSYEDGLSRMKCGIYDAEETRRLFFAGDFYQCAWGGVFTREFIGDYRFLVPLKAEDFAFSSFMYCQNRGFTMQYLTDRLYNYRIGRAGQIMAQELSVRQDLIIGMQITLQQLKAVKSKHIRYLADYYIDRLIFEDRVGCEHSRLERKKLRAQIWRDISFPWFKFPVSRKELVRSIMFKTAPWFYRAIFHRRAERLHSR